MRHLTVRITPWEKRRLRQLRDRRGGGVSPRLVKRAICLLRSAVGDSATLIARVTGLNPDTITDIRRRWRQQRMHSLQDRRRPGRPPRVTDAYRCELRRALRVGPLACGYALSVWSIARLRTHLRQRTGITVSTDWLRRLAHREGFVVARPKHTLKGKRDERAYRRAARRLKQLKKGPCKRARLMNCGTPTPPRLPCSRTSCAAGCRAGDSGR